MKSSIALNDEESTAFNAITITFEKLTSKLSKKHFDPLLKRMKKYASTHVLEPKLAGPMFSSMVKALATAQPDETLDFFIPHLCSEIANILQEKSLHSKVIHHRDAGVCGGGEGGQGGYCLPVLGRSVNPFRTRGADYHITTTTLPKFFLSQVFLLVKPPSDVLFLFRNEKLLIKI